jgi:hypothetical protein
MSDNAEPLQKTGEAVAPQSTAASEGGKPDSGKPASSDVPPPPERKSERYTCKPDQTPGWKMVLETGAVFIALGLLIANICQMRATREAVEKSSEANELNREGLYSVQRAFIVAGKPTTETPTYNVINGVPQKKPVKMIEFTSHWENVGNTPAIGVVTAVGKVVQADEITEQEFMGTAIDRASAKSAIGPKAILDSGTLRDGETFLTDNPSVPRFMWGWMVYRDTFPKTKPHVTEWCWKITEIAWELDGNGKHTGKPHLTASTCGHHNCIDEFCEDYASITALSQPN